MFPRRVSFRSAKPLLSLRNGNLNHFPLCCEEIFLSSVSHSLSTVGNRSQKHEFIFYLIEIFCKGLGGESFHCCTISMLSWIENWKTQLVFGLLKAYRFKLNSAVHFCFNLQPIGLDCKLYFSAVSLEISETRKCFNTQMYDQRTAQRPPNAGKPISEPRNNQSNYGTLPKPARIDMPTVPKNEFLDLLA